jgi:hypothetical protein
MYSHGDVEFCGIVVWIELRREHYSLLLRVISLGGGNAEVTRSSGPLYVLRRVEMFVAPSVTPM